MQSPAGTDTSSLPVAGLLFYVHLGAVVLFLVALAALVATVEAAGRPTRNAELVQRTYVRTFRWYNPLSIALLGVALLTGAWLLTPIKHSLGPRFFSVVGTPLALKLACAFVLINIAAYVSFAVCHPLVRNHQRGDQLEAVALLRLRRRLRLGIALTLLITAATVWTAEQVAVRLAGP